MDIYFIRDHSDLVKLNQQKRFKSVEIVDKILELDSRWKTMKWNQDNLRKLKNIATGCFKNAPPKATVFWDDHEHTLDKVIDSLANGRIQMSVFIREQLKVISTYINYKIENHESETKQILFDRDSLIAELANDTHTNCVISDNEDNNSIIFETGVKTKEDVDKIMDHIDLLDKLGFTDTTNGIKVAGNRGYFLTGQGVKLNQAILNYALDYLQRNEYTLMETPHVVNKDLMGKICQLSEYEETLYKLEGFDKFLIATSEQPLTAMFSDTIIDPAKLPIKIGGLSSCYRKEAGAHARHTRGIYRVHQFQKVEQFCVTDPDNSWSMFEKMIDVSKQFYLSLGIDFRIVSIVSGALNNAAAMKYDLEAYFPGSKEWCELVSCTNVKDYFSKRISLKGTKQEYLHMLNCTLCANTRVLCALVETHQTNEGFVVPKVLLPYMNMKEGENLIPFVK